MQNFYSFQNGVAYFISSHRPKIKIKRNEIISKVKPPIKKEIPIKIIEKIYIKETC